MRAHQQSRGALPGWAPQINSHSLAESSLPSAVSFSSTTNGVFSNLEERLSFVKHAEKNGTRRLWMQALSLLLHAFKTIAFP